MSNPLIHTCTLAEDSQIGFKKLPPNASMWHKFTRKFWLSLSPSLSLAISKRYFRNASQIKAEKRRHAPFRTIHPYSKMAMLREVLFFIAILWKSFANPLISSFHSVSVITFYFQFEVSTTVRFLDYVMSFLLTIWIVSCFFAGYKERIEGKKTIQLHKTAIVKRYLKTYFLIDLLMLYPTVERDLETFGEYGFLVHSIVLFRFPSLIMILKRFLADLKLPTEVIIGSLLILMSLYILHYFTCLFFFLPMLDLDSDELWVEKAKLFPYQPHSIIYKGCYSLIMLHFWGLAESEYQVEGKTEQIVLIIVMVVGKLWSLTVIATILIMFTTSSLSESQYDKYLIQLKTFISQNNLPKNMEDRMLAYYEYKYQHNFFKEDEIVDSLSKFLKQELILFRARKVVEKFGIFKYFSPSIIARIIEQCKILVYMNNDCIIKSGQAIDHLYFVSSGTIAVFNPNGFELSHLKDGAELGVKGVTTMYRTYFRYTYIAIETTELYVMDIKEFRKYVYSTPEILKFFLKKVADTTETWQNIERKATTTVVDFLSELKQERVLEHPRVRTVALDD